MRLQLLTPPAEPALDLDRVKEHLEVFHAEDDDSLAAHARTAVSHIDGAKGWLGRALVTQTWTLQLRGFWTDDLFAMPLPPLQAVTAIRYLDAAGDLQVLDEASYAVHLGEDPAIELLVDPPAVADRVYPVTIEFVAGHGDDHTAIPDAITSALLLMVGDLAANRETSVTGTISSEIKMSTTVEDLLRPYWTRGA